MLCNNRFIITFHSDIKVCLRISYHDVLSIFDCFSVCVVTLCQTLSKEEDKLHFES